MGAIAAYLGDADDAIDRVRSMVESVPHRGRATRYITLGRCTIGAAWDAEAPDVEVGSLGDLAVAVVGIVDNQAELLQELAIPRVRATGARESDSGLVELLITGYRVHGRDFPALLRGMFACIVTDGSTAYCFRDQLGFKPLFYRHDGREFWAGSEPKQVVRGARIPHEPDLSVVQAIFYRTLDDSSPAALRGVERLPKMTGLVVEAGRAYRRRYWFPERLLETGAFGDAELKERFDDLMSAAVQRSLSGNDVIFLSGGIDSPAIAAYATPLHQETYGGGLQAVSIVYPKYPSVDESGYVKLLADHYGMPLHVYEQEANAMDGFQRWTALVDGPYRSAALAQLEEAYLHVRRLGSRNILSGSLAEFVTAIQWFTLDHYLSHARYRSAWRHLMAYRLNGRSWPEIARRAGRAAVPRRLVNAADRLRGRGSPTVPAWVDLRMATSENPVPARERWRRSQLGAFIGPGTSLEADEVCQAVCGVTLRRPWADVDLWEFFLSLPAEQKFPDLGVKSLVRKLLRGRVPDVILDRTDKTVFDEAHLDRIDYELLEKLLIDPGYHVPGVDYRALGHLITEQRLTMVDYQWSRDLANIHAFLAQWSDGDSRTAPQWVRKPEGATA